MRDIYCLNDEARAHALGPQAIGEQGLKEQG
jgi:hypothetical protein